MSGDGIRAYAGEFLVSPAGLELSMNWCGHACTYCFANWMKPNRRADVRSVVGLLAEYRQRKSREARLLQAGVPMLVSNHVDPFAGSNVMQFEPIWELCVELGVPLTWQTRGAHRAHWKIQERIIRETPRAVWYVSIPMLDDAVRKHVEPHAPSIGSRLDLVDQLIEAGHVVTVGINPLTVEWMPELEPLLDLLTEKGVWGVWIQVPYFSKTFKGNIDANARDRLGVKFMQRCGEKGSKEDKRHVEAAMAYAKGIGLQVFSTEYEEPTRYFEPWHEVYERVMPYWHQLVNEIDPLLDEDDPEDYVVVTKGEAREVLSPLPELDWSEPLRHKRARRYREVVERLPSGRLPKQDVDGFWDLMWNDELFCKSLGPTSFRRFAHACVVEDGVIHPLLDEQGDRLAVYRRKGFEYLYFETQEIA